MRRRRASPSRSKHRCDGVRGRFDRHGDPTTGPDHRTGATRRFLDCPEEVAPLAVQDFDATDRPPSGHRFGSRALVNQKILPRHEPPSTRPGSPPEAERTVSREPRWVADPSVRESCVARSPGFGRFAGVSKGESDCPKRTGASDENLVGGYAVSDNSGLQHPEGPIELQTLAMTVGRNDCSPGLSRLDDDVDGGHGDPASAQSAFHVPVCEIFRTCRPSRRTVFMVNDVSPSRVTVERLRERPRRRTEHSPRIRCVPSVAREDSNRQPSRSTIPSPQ